MSKGLSTSEIESSMIEPATILAFVYAGLADVALLGLVGVVIPVVGLALALFIFLSHWFVGALVIAMLWSKIRGWLATLILLLVWIIPIFPLTLGIGLALFASTTIGKLATEQAAILVLAAVSGGVGATLEVAEVAEIGAEATEVAVEAAEGIGEAASAIEGAGEAAEAAETAGEAGEAAEGAEDAENMGEKFKKFRDRMDQLDQGNSEEDEEGDQGELADTLQTAEERNPMENLQENLFEYQDPPKAAEQEEEESPEVRQLEKNFSKAQKVVDISSRQPKKTRAAGDSSNIDAAA